MIILNGKLIESDDQYISLKDRGYQFGDGVYEVIRTYNGNCYKLDEHINRLFKSAEKILIEIAYSFNEIRKLIIQLVKINKVKDGIVYIQITRGVADRKHNFPENISPFMVGYTQQVDRPREKLREGIRTVLFKDIRWLRCDIKSINLLGNVLAKQSAVDNACEEAILHRDGIVTEGSSSNVFIVKNKVIYTHPVNNFILNGITRLEVIRIAETFGLEVVEESFSTTDLLKADEVFITSTTAEITPVIMVNGKEIGNGFPGIITRELQSNFESELIELEDKIHYL